MGVETFNEISQATEINDIAEHMKKLIANGINIATISFYDIHTRFFPNAPHPDTLYIAYLTINNTSKHSHMKQKRFQFETPLLPGNGTVSIEGVIYRDESKGFDIDEVNYNGTNILPVLNWLGDGSVNELDKVYNVTEQHCQYLRQTWNEQPDFVTDLNQLAA